MDGHGLVDVPYPPGGGSVMPRSRWGSVGSVVLVIVIALLVVVGGAVAFSRTAVSDVPGSDGRRRLGASGVLVAVPDGWVDKRGGADEDLLLEVEHRPVAGLFATRGMWVGRWNAWDDWAEGSVDGPQIAGFRSVHREDRIGPPAVVGRLPASVTLHRSIFRVSAYERVYEVGFWGQRATLGDDVERAVLASLSIEEPPPIELAHDGVSLTVPSLWNLGECKDSVCASSPFVDGKPNDSWIYVFPWKARSMDAGVERLLGSLSKQPTVRDLVSEPTTVAGQPAIRVRFGMTPEDTGPAEYEELIVRGRTDFVLVALGWRTPEGRVQLDSVMQTLRL